MWHPHWETMAGTIIIAIFGFTDPENMDIDTIINFLSTVYYSPIYGTLEIHVSHFENGCPSPPQTNTIAIFGFRDSENNGIDTIINFLSILFAEIWNIDNSCQPFWKWLPHPHRPNLVGVPSWNTFSWDMLAVYQISCLYHKMHDFSLGIRTNDHIRYLAIPVRIHSWIHVAYLGFMILRHRWLRTVGFSYGPLTAEKLENGELEPEMFYSANQNQLMLMTLLRIWTR